MLRNFGKQHEFGTTGYWGLGNRISVRKILVLLAGVVLSVVLIFSGIVFLDIFLSIPSEETVKREFLVRYPKAKISNLELIFEQDGGVVYLVTAKEDDGAVEGKYDFALRRSNGLWSWCDDRTNNPCGSIAR
jgi:hypothetical protein